MVRRRVRVRRAPLSDSRRYLDDRSDGPTEYATVVVVGAADEKGLLVLMPRVYPKNPDARRARITIPISAGLLAQIKKLADRSGIASTTLVHYLVESGVDAIRIGKIEWSSLVNSASFIDATRRRSINEIRKRKLDV